MSLEGLVREVCPPDQPKLHSSDVVCDGPSGVVGGVSQRGVSSWLTQVVLTGCSGVSTWHASDLPAYAIELSDYLGASGDVLRMFRH